MYTTILYPMYVEVKLFNEELMKNLGILKREDFMEGEYSFPYKTDGSLAFDLRAVIERDIYLYKGQTVMIPTGISVNAYNGSVEFGLLILPRSGLSTKGIVLGNQIGVIDADYQGQLMVILTNKRKSNNKNEDEYVIEPGERIAQAMFVPKIQKSYGKIVSEFSKSSLRGDGGFGHTGKF